MSLVLYACLVDSITYVVVNTSPYLTQAVGLVSIYVNNPWKEQ